MKRPTDLTASHDHALERWESEGGALGPRPPFDFERSQDPVSHAQVLEVLDFLAAHVPGHPLASKIAAKLAASIRIRGI